MGVGTMMGFYEFYVPTFFYLLGKSETRLNEFSYCYYYYTYEDADDQANVDVLIYGPCTTLS